MNESDDDATEEQDEDDAPSRWSEQPPSRLLNVVLVVLSIVTVGLAILVALEFVGSSDGATPNTPQTTLNQPEVSIADTQSAETGATSTGRGAQATTETTEATTETTTETADTQATTETTEATTTTETTEATTTTETTTETTEATPALFIAPVGTPREPGELPLDSGGIGELRLGDPADRVLGVLAASFGQPDADSGSITSIGLNSTCRGDRVRIVRWGRLTIAIDVSLGDEPDTFFSYRLDARQPDPQSPTARLATVSGLSTGDSLAQLESIYGSVYDVSYTTDPNEGAVFEITDQGVLLIWGPVTSVGSSGWVQGIFSPVTCD